MTRYLPLVIGCALAASPLSVLRAEDIPAATVTSVKKATVFVRVQGDGWTSTGSGFVVGGDEKALFLATNQHVAEPDPPPGARPGRAPTLSVVFDSGTKTERVFSATVAGADAQRDLAVLKVVGVKEPPKALTAADTTKLTETATVYTFGFPFGEALSSIEKANPAITVGKASVSSFRNGPDGELAAIQIDGNLNPGNSGGPVVNAAGQFVGVAVSRIKSAGIGFIVPAGEMDAMMKSRVSSVRVIPPKIGAAPMTARIEATVADPTGRLKETFAYFLLIPAGQKPPTVTDLIDHPDSRKIMLRFDKGVGIAEVPLKAAGGEMLLQVAAETADKPVATKVKPYPLAAVAGVPDVADVLAPPPAGWKEYTPPDRSFKMWVPEKPARQANDERTSMVDGQRMRVSVVAGETAAGLIYEGQTISLPLGFNRPTPREMHDLFRDAIADALKGKVVESKPVRGGRMTGFEHRIEVGKQVVRMRVCVFASNVLVVHVFGTADQVATVEADTILASFGFAGADTRPRTNPSTNPGPGPGGGAVTVVPSGPAPTIVGGGERPPFGGPIFKDLAPTGGLLIGVEVVIGRPYGDELVRSVKPIYLTDAKENFGKQFGTVLDKPITLKAKPGYAVGGISVKARNVCDGFSLTFMKVVNGKLDPKDSYESEWLGWNGGVQATKVLSDGPPAVGFAGRASDREVCGIGVVFKGQEAFATTGPIAKEPTILGGAFDPIFKELAPDGGLLVGFEIGTAQAFGHNMTRAARPIYRAGDKESFGEQRGTQLGNVVTLKAKPGYAVGAVSVMSGLGFDGIKLTYMKVADGKLDPADSYDSEYVGSGQNKPLTKLGGDGTPVVGVIGKTNAKDMTGLGILLKGQEGYIPKKR